MTLCINNLEFSRNNEPLFSGIHNTLSPGELLQVQGANGSGKSTLLRILAGYIQSEIDMVLWHSKSIFQQLDYYTEELCYLGHQNGIKSYLTVYENLKLSCALSGKKISREQLKPVLASMQLEQAINTQAIHLSAGQKRRLALSRLQLTPRQLWILDEPTTALDSSGQHLFADMLKKHLLQGGMAVVATHHDLRITNKIKILQLSRMDAPHV